ncbi:YdcF family protein [Cognatiyoonia sp. IB215182]|uniref:YdcF family protein n=1 Tax=Cognatiyoonia sp. IB215182 TaxID=3097353 RepID=UPI002A114768|nr:YdcF family protein [Cognatiyoonia sp. IB215182]MDX8354384.1 YdcF family protein [Cognatiyoonia sp. IB215182]
MEIRTAARILWGFHCVYDDLQRSDVIIGLGSYDMRVATRCAELFHAGLSERIIFSGASGNWTSALYQVTEAEAFKDQAIKDGVPEDAIMLERCATHIGENISFSAKLVPTARRVIIVTKPQTQLRCKATVLRQWPCVTALITAPATSFDAQPLPHHDERALFCEMVGDVARMKSYAERGFQVPIEIPDAVQSAFDRLVNAGFTDHLPT